MQSKVVKAEVFVIALIGCSGCCCALQSSSCHCFVFLWEVRLGSKVTYTVMSHGTKV